MNTYLGSTLTGREPGQVEVFFRVVRRHRWLVALALLAGVAAALLVTARQRPVYEATATLSIHSPAKALELPVALLAQSPGTIGTDIGVLGSRTAATEVVRALKLQLRVDVPSDEPRGALLSGIEVDSVARPVRLLLERGGDGRFTVTDTGRGRVVGRVRPGERVRVAGASFRLTPAAAERSRLRLRLLPLEAAVKELQDHLSIERMSRDAELVALVYRDGDPALVREVPNRLAADFIQRRQMEARSDAHSTVRFLREQIPLIAAQLQTAEDRLRGFRESSRTVDPQAEAASRIQENATLLGQRTAIEAEHAALASLLGEIQRENAHRGRDAPSPYRKLVGFPTIFRNQATSQLLSSLTALENERSGLLMRRNPEDQDVQILTRRIVALEGELQGVSETYLAGLAEQVHALDASLAGYRASLAEIPAKELSFARLQREVSVLQEIYTLLQTRIKEAEIAEAADVADVRVVDTAITPSRPVEPRPVRNLAAGLVLGLALGLAGAFGREYADRSVRTRGDIVHITGLPVLGFIPTMRTHDRRIGRLVSDPPTPELPAGDRRGRRDAAGWRLPRGAVPVLPSDPLADERGRYGNAAAEAYSQFATNVFFSQQEPELRTLVITSALPNEGKTLSATNAAVAFARRGLRVLLVDGDLRRGTLHRLAHARRSPGLSEILDGTGKTDECIVPLGAEPGCSVSLLPAGAHPLNPTGLVGSDRMRSLLERLKADFDLVVIDTPPLNLVSDAALLSAAADGVVLVARVGATPVPALEYAMDQLQNVQARVLGTLFNDVDLRRDSGYDATYRYMSSEYYRYPAEADDAR